MYRETLKFTDFDGNEREEEFLFNLTEQEVAQMQLTTVGGLDTYIQRITSEQDVPKIIGLFQELIDLSYGAKTADGRGFKKSPEILDNFKCTQAYSDFYMSLINDPEKAAKFVEGITPAAPKEPQDHKPGNKVTPINK